MSARSSAWGPGGEGGSARDGLAEAWSGFRTATRLGWQMEANWTDPILFLIYSVAKPVSSALIFVLMIEVVGGAGSRDLRGFVVAGSALWAFVMSGIAGLAWSILDDRERYRMLKYVYVSPSDFLVVLLGRGVARLAVGAMGAAITLALGVLALGVPFDPFGIDWLLLAVVLPAGLVAIVSVGLLLAAICIQTRQESWAYPEAAAGALFLVSGAVFPLGVLPAPLQVVGWINPFLWWIEGMRRALLSGHVTGVGGPGSAWATWFGSVAPSSLELVVALLATGALGTLAAIAVFRWSERRAKERGLLDMTTGS
jgi:ABC-2 type transport system permease protein